MNTRIRIDYDGARNITQVQKAVSIANSLLHCDDFYSRLSQHPGFDLANIPPGLIADLMQHTDIRVSVSLYYALSPLKNYDGYDDIEDPSRIHLNAWKIDRTPASICNTIVHGCVHAVNAHYPQYYFGHGDMSGVGKENTAPYWIGALAQQMASEGNCYVVPLEHDHYEPMVKDMRKMYP